MSFYVGTVIGFRSWKVNSFTYGLNGPVSRAVWPADRKMAAICMDVAVNPHRIHEPHDSPDPRCCCGLYAYHDLGNAIRNYSQNSCALIGVGAFWGKITVHTQGFKAQYGRVLALSDHKERNQLQWSETLEGVSEKYGIPVIPVDMLEEYGLTFGERMGTRFEE